MKTVKILQQENDTILKVKDSHLELEKDFKPSIIFLDDSDEFEEKNNEEENVSKKYLVQLVQLVNQLCS